MPCCGLLHSVKRVLVHHHEPDLSCANDESLSVKERAAAMIKKGEEAAESALPELEKMFQRTLPKQEGV